MLTLSEWQTLFSVEAGCAATLTGLVFVAVSINIAKILAAPGLPGRAAESIAQFLQVFFVCMTGMIPRQPAAALATEICCVTFLSWMVQFISQINYVRLRAGHPKWWLVTRIVQTQLGCVPLFVGAICILNGGSAGPYWLALGFFFSFFAGVLNAWILLIEIHR